MAAHLISACFKHGERLKAQQIKQEAPPAEWECHLLCFLRGVLCCGCLSKEVCFSIVMSFSLLPFIYFSEQICTVKVCCRIKSLHETREFYNSKTAAYSLTCKILYQSQETFSSHCGELFCCWCFCISSNTAKFTQVRKILFVFVSQVFFSPLIYRHLPVTAQKNNEIQ